MLHRQLQVLPQFMLAVVEEAQDMEESQDQVQLLQGLEDLVAADMVVDHQVIQHLMIQALE